ncbi:MAG: hypothetical protein KBE07_09660 [Rhodoferax sp.]|jgi:hypothetical protein|nr:hypothetical protein [Comamonas sp.]MBP9684904.1 hypothetical protein [Rhodoferax sp.]
MSIPVISFSGLSFRQAKKPLFLRIHPATSPVAILAGMLATVLLSACGGSGSPEPAPQPTPGPVTVTLSAAQLQGRWATSAGVAPARTAIVLPSASGRTEMWLLNSDLLSLSRVQITTSGTDAVTASGKSYTLPSTSKQPAQTVSYSGSANLSTNSLSLNAGALLLTRSDTLATPNTLVDVAGSWRTSAGSQAVTVSLSVAATGAMSGTSSTGCSYSGNLTARSDASAYQASLTETCTGSSVNFSGIATYRSNPAALTLAMTSTDEAQALVLSLLKP